MASETEDSRWMRAALALARRGLGRVAPNPAVGCILVQGGVAVGRGWTQPGGRPHAETEALRRAGSAAQGATAYVTLEPCSHFGQTGPCALALIDAGIGRAVIAMEDPDARVSGRGIDMLQQAGIPTELGVLEADARAVNIGFLLHRTQNRPMVTLKTAMTLDGRIATATGESQWITGSQARADAHLERMTHDAVLVGIGTALADDPALTCRLPGVDSARLRVVLDSGGRLPAGGKLTDDTAPTLQIVAKDADFGPPPAGAAQACVTADEDGRLRISEVLRILAAEGVTRLMVEGGGQVAASFLKADLVDRIVCYRAGVVLGGDARPALGALNISALSDASRFRLTSSRQVGPDRVEEYLR